MPATILPFERREAPRSPSEEAEPPPPALRAFRPPSRPTSRQIAHRWAMLSHLRRHFRRRLPDPIR
jgi:hypothetical protein